MTIVDNPVRGLFVNSDRSVSELLRRRRWERFLTHFPDIEQLRVLDLGGTTLFWQRASRRPAHVTVVNLFAPGDGAPGVAAIAGDALQAEALTGGAPFDLVFSNSLIEHLGGHRMRAGFADVVRRMAPAYWVQTPYRYFPVEPHWVFPGFQFLPLATRSWLAPRWPLGHTHSWEPEAAREEAMSTELLSGTEMSSYFPDGEILWERFAGLPKSMTVLRTGPGRATAPTAAAGEAARS